MPKGKSVKYELTDIVKIKKPTRKGFRDLEGQKFGRLKIIGFAGFKNNNSIWWAECDYGKCGNIIKVYRSSLIGGTTKSCGCYDKELKDLRNKTHEMTHTPEYTSYQGAKYRCQNSNSKQYEWYGGRGIEFRFNSFKEFYEELGEKPEPKRNYSVERIDNSRHYERGNVKWATSKEQMSNIRNNRWITWNNKTQLISDWSIELGIKVTTLLSRLDIYNYCNNCTFTKKPWENPCPHR